MNRFVVFVSNELFSTTNKTVCLFREGNVHLHCRTGAAQNDERNRWRKQLNHAHLYATGRLESSSLRDMKS